MGCYNAWVYMYPLFKNVPLPAEMVTDSLTLPEEHLYNKWVTGSLMVCLPPMYENVSHPTGVLQWYPSLMDVAVFYMTIPLRSSSHTVSDGPNVPNEGRIM
jgi:hypothetical protein